MIGYPLKCNSVSNWLIGDVFMLLVHVGSVSTGLICWPIVLPCKIVLMVGAVIDDMPDECDWAKRLSPLYDGTLSVGKLNMSTPKDAPAAGTESANASRSTTSILILLKSTLSSTINHRCIRVVK